MGGKSSIFQSGALDALEQKSQFAKFGSTSTFKSVNWIKNDACPIQVMATCPGFSLGKIGR